MTARPIFKGEARVLGWSHSSSTPYAVRLQLHRDDIHGEAHPFDGLQGQTVTMLIGQVDETPPSGDGPEAGIPSGEGHSAGARAHRGSAANSREPAGTGESSTPPPRPASSRPWHTLTRSQQAGIRCGDKAFREWLCGKGCTVERAALEIRKVCGIRSRSDLSMSLATGQQPDAEAVRKWDELDAAYRAWAGLEPEQRG